jgi:hypothetical protein
LTVAGNTTLSGGTANGVAYLNASKVLTTGSALTFNGTNIGLNNDGYLVFASPSSAIAEKSRIQWLIEDGSEMSSIRVNRVNAFGESSMGFYTRGGGPSALRYSIGVDGTSIWSVGGSEQMRLNSTGLGIGTSSPDQKLAVNGNAKLFNYGKLQLANGVNTTKWSIWDESVTGNDNLQFDSSSVTGALVLTQSGNLGLGTATPVSGTNQTSLTINGTTVGRLDLWSGGSSRFDIEASSSTTNIVNAGLTPFVYYINGAERMRLDTDGRLRIAETNNTGANSKLVVGTGNAGTNGLIVANTANGAFPALSLSNWTGSSTTKGPYIAFDNSGRGSWSIGSGDGVNSFDICQTWGTPVASIDSSGNLLVGTTSNIINSNARATFVGNEGIRVQATANGGASIGSFLSNNEATHFVGYDLTASAIKFQVLFNGNVQNTNNSYGAISDVKLKENIVDASPKLNDLMQVKVRNYNLKTEPTHKQIGVIAQELETIFPAMIEETPDRDSKNNNLGTTTKSVKYSVFVPILIKAMQEQQALIESLTARLNALENK